MKKMLFSPLIVVFLFSCSDGELMNKQLSGKWIEQSPMANRTEIVFESNDLMKVTLQNPERVLSYTILNFKEDSIELSDNLADMNNNVKLYFKTINDS